MIYLLGGPPRVGKSIISKTITNKYSNPVCMRPDLAKAAAKMTVRSKKSSFQNGGVLQTRQAGV